MSDRMRLQPGRSEVMKPRTIAFASGKGGVGKSVLTWNLASCLAEHGRVLMVDCDFQLGNLHILANVTPPVGISRVCSGEVPLAEAVIAAAEKIDLLPAVYPSDDAPFPKIKALAEFIAALPEKAQGYDFVLFDTASGILPHVNLVLHAVDEVVLVLTPELTSISDSYALYKILLANDANIEASLIVNRESRKEEAEYIYRKFAAMTETYLGRMPRWLGAVGLEPLVTDSVAEQKPISAVAPKSLTNNDLQEIADRLAGSIGPVGTRFQRPSDEGVNSHLDLTDKGIIAK
jgi:flagellar biosynthesis protein FlhG